VGGVAADDRVGAGTLAARRAFPLSAVIAVLGDATGDALREILISKIENEHTRNAYGRALGQLCTWCETQGLGSILELDPILGRRYATHLL
jgi:hypothetical protein